MKLILVHSSLKDTAPTPTALPTINPVGSVVNTIIHGAIYTVAVNAAYAYIVSVAPFFGFPIVSTLFKWVLDWIAGYIYVAFAQMGVTIVIDIQTASEQAAYDDAAANVTTAVQSGDQNAINQAATAFGNALAGLINFDGIVPVQKLHRFNVARLNKRLRNHIS